MSNIITLKRRIASVKSTKQITKAMELVSASKMRRAQDYALQSREYRDVAYSLLQRLGSIKEVDTHPLFQQRTVKNRLYIVITSNSGLAGAYNYNVMKLLSGSIAADKQAAVKSHVITIGKQAANFVRRLQGVDLMAVYPAFNDHPEANDVRPILNTLVDQYKNGHVDEVLLVYTMFKSNLVQQVQLLSLLPADTPGQPDRLDYKYKFTNFEPSVDVVIDNIATRLIEAQIWQSVLESLASEHSMRMLAMKNATDNANDLIDNLTLVFNTARQANITQELAEITGGAEALRD
ncbi:MAG TPA: ATP synthase F1 subunit gamma [Candidatus Saccharimonadales bacterium]|nr:ATP synthase F1 subunit gamma [Candidatus Saccharimonadales bacterium]